MKRSELTSKVAAAIAGRSLVCITRKVEAGTAKGYIVDASEQWQVLLLIGGGISYEGFQVFRLQDVTSLEMRAPYADFYEAAIRKRGLRRPRAPKLDLSSAQALVQSAGKRYPLITIHREKADPEVCHIGQVVSLSASSVSLLEVGPDAIWEDLPTKYRLAEITRVDFAGPYEEALALVAMKR